ncbi:ATP-binding cassette domain-containing protein, partial [Flavonifractor sp.]|uniref:ATP-binding cassette domain-containing protein n=1 Tax=Flavonifractor sp. TaxID=2049025 RepID=UPI0025BBAFBB
VKAQVGVVLDETTFHDGLTAPQVGKILAKLYPNWDMALYQRYLDKFGLAGKKPVKTFSKGMKMKLSLAAAFAARPKLLILDEATSGLDPVVRDEILDEFLDFIQDEEHAILLSSHITSDLEKVADYVTYLHRGKVAVSGAKDELLDTYGRLVCSRSDLEQVDPALLVGVRTGQFGCEALVKDKHAFVRRYPGLTVDPVTLEDIMVFTVKGDAK